MEQRGLTGRVAVITGASAGIGEAVARDLAANGAGVIVNARREEKISGLVSDLRESGGEAEAIAGDAADQSVIDAMLDAGRAMAERLGGGLTDADIVVANAGRGLAGSVMGSNTAEWEEMTRINFLGCARLIRSAGKRMLEMAPEEDPLRRARDLVVLGSTVGRHISPFSSMYGSTKFAVNSMAEAARRELGPRGIRVSLIEPGIVKSEFQDVAGYDPKGFGEHMERIGPVLAPEDVARLVTFIVTQPVNVHVNDVVIRATRQDYP